MTPSRRATPALPLLILVAAYLIAAIWLAFRMGPFASPNEGLHYDYVAVLRRTGQLPPPTDLADERHQPPIYYALAALFGRPVETHQAQEFVSNPFFAATYRGNFNPVIHPSPMIYAARLATVLFGLLGVVGLYVAARLLLGPNIALLAAALLAFQPNYLYLSAAVSNDVPVAAVGAWVLAACAWLVIKQPSVLWFLGLGGLFALALLTKANAIVFGALIAGACLATWRRAGLKGVIARAALATVGLALAYAPWFLYNQSRGDTMGLDKTVPLDRLLRLSPLAFPRLLPFAERMWRSVWLDWSPGELGYAPEPYYWVVLVLSLLALLGLIWRWRRLEEATSGRVVMWAGVLSVLGLGYLYIAAKTLLVVEQPFFVPEGRWMLPVLPIMALLIGAGWAAWWPAWWPKSRRHIASLGAAFVAVGSVGVLLVVFLPNIQPIATPTRALPTEAQQPDLAYGDDQALQLRGVQAPDAVLGQRLDASLYWSSTQALPADYIVAAQVLVPTAGPGSELQKLDAQNTYPGYGLSPTRDWPAQTLLADQLTFYPRDATLNGPTQGYLLISLLDGESKPIPAWRNGQPEPNPIAQTLTLRPPTPLQPPAEVTRPAVQFGPAIQLLAYSLQWTDDAHLRISLWWQATGDVGADYVAFVHALGEGNAPLAQSDAVPNLERSPTHLWRTGDVVLDVRELNVPRSQVAQLALGLYAPTTGERVAASVQGQPLADNLFLISSPQLP